MAFAAARLLKDKQLKEQQIDIKKVFLSTTNLDTGLKKFSLSPAAHRIWNWSGPTFIKRKSVGTHSKKTVIDACCDLSMWLLTPFSIGILLYWHRLQIGLICRTVYCEKLKLNCYLGHDLGSKKFICFLRVSRSSRSCFIEVFFPIHYNSINQRNDKRFFG